MERRGDLVDARELGMGTKHAGVTWKNVRVLSGYARSELGEKYGARQLLQNFPQKYVLELRPMAVLLSRLGCLKKLKIPASSVIIAPKASPILVVIPGLNMWVPDSGVPLPCVQWVDEDKRSYDRTVRKPPFIVRQDVHPL